MTHAQKQTLKETLTTESDFWTCGQIVNLIKERFLVTYTKPQVQRLLGQMQMYRYKPQPRDYSQSEHHKEQFSQRLQGVADVLGMGTKNISNMAIAFGDESTFQPHRPLDLCDVKIPRKS